ncbi:alcohol oxidase [Thozetella sp. PMI_491]|nr:alcohol oxidase [Thozetella sp. PMI_491]
MLLKAWSSLFLLVGAATAESYDYIIVGGGTAGGALATRLSLGLPSAKILVLEAGPSALDEIRINVPGMRGSILYTNYDWNFTTIPQENLGGRTIDVNRAKVLGGSSAMNYLCYDRASSPEYDAWGEMGSDGWDWNLMFDAMTKSENFTGVDQDVRGRVGPIRNLYNRVVFDVLKSWQPTATALGLPLNEGGNMAGDPIGLMFQGTNIDSTHYTRSYSANSYLPLAGSNLVVKTNTQVAKVNFADQLCHGKRFATGVTLLDGTQINATKEVILSAGSIQSPGLLELSGIGQSAVLEAAGIETLIELPGVGENYQDHIRTSNNYRLKEGVESFDPYIYDSGSENATAEVQKWIDNEVSIYDYTSAAYGFLNWGQVDADTQANLVQLAQAAVANSSSPIDQKKLEYLSNPNVPDLEYIFEANYVGAKGYSGGNFVTLFSTTMHALSRGNVHINPQDPHGKPIIDPKYLDNEYDVQAVIAGAKFARKIANTEPMSTFWELETEPGPEVETEEQWREFATSTVNSFYHPVGTCSLLPEEDGGVVDANLKVFGTQNLRVVDNSIIPIILSGHIQTAAYGIAEVAAAKIISGN